MSIKDIWEKLMNNPQIGGFIKKNKGLLEKIGILAVVAIIAGTVMFSNNNKQSKEVSAESESLVTEETVVDKVWVDIGGEVKSPKVVELDDGSRVQDAIDAAGGLTSEADITNLNRAALVNDGDKIYVPAVGDESGASGSTSGGVSTTGGKVNINTADSEELQTITGVGPATAEKIISYRESNGRFKAIEDIKNVSGIGDKTFEKMKEIITT